jgi:predicted metal-dependent phosphoesterase TrpH
LNVDNLIHADFHLHTKYSMDSSSSPEDIVTRCSEMGINCIAVTDHNAFDGALKLKEIAPFTVIPGEEILTPNGEVIGYFMKEYIPSNQPLSTVIDKLKEQGALVALPHPFDTFRGLKNLSAAEMDDLAAQIDIVEVFNARTLLPGDSDKAVAFAKKHSLAGSAGSDAHSIREIGKTYVEMQQFGDPKSFLKSLARARIQRRRSSPFVHAYTVFSKMLKAF